MIRPFAEYLKDGSVEKQLPDIHQAHALMSKAEKRLAYVNERPIREASHALMTLVGLKPLSHEAVIAFLRDKEGIDQGRITRFDGYRRLRNSSLYAAQEISAAKAQEAVQFASELFKTLRSKLKP